MKAEKVEGRGGLAANGRTDGNGCRLSSFEPTCEATCDCVRKKFSPICGVDGKTYFSACHAGCSNYTVVDGKVASVSKNGN